MVFPRQEYWSGLPCPSSMDLPYLVIESISPALTRGFFTTEPPGKPHQLTQTFYLVLFIIFLLKVWDQTNYPSNFAISHLGFYIGFVYKSKMLKGIYHVPLRECHAPAGLGHLLPWEFIELVGNSLLSFHLSLFWSPTRETTWLRQYDHLCHYTCIVIPLSRGSSQLRDQTQVSHIAGGFFTSWATREACISSRNIFTR